MQLMLRSSILFALLWAACKPFDPSPNNPNEKPLEDQSLQELVIPDGFLFASTQNTALSITAVDNANRFMGKVPFKVWAAGGGTAAPVLLLSGQTGETGPLETTVSIPTATEKLRIETTYPGLPPVSVDWAGQSNLQITLGANNLMAGRAGHSAETPKAPNEKGAADRSTFTYLGSYNNQGVPNYLTPQGDVVSQDILNMIAASLPESAPVPNNHPEYITSGVQSNTILTDSAEVWVTFVHEGAGYLNALGYYTYPNGQTPQSAAQIGALNVIFPNVSFSGSGGGLHTGDKVYLGVFPAGTTIGWFVVPNGWQSSSQTVSDANSPIHYSDEEYNTFTQPQYRNHVVQLVDPNRELLLLGFEDIGRPGGDNDFNDAIFYVTANPFTAIDQTAMAITNIGGSDSDGDGVPDDTDEAPNNPNWAFKTFTPSASTMGTLAFEDFYPSKGDYDMNDLVLDYQVEEHTDAAGKIVELIATIKLRAMGAGYRNGFGFELPIPYDQVASVTGTNISENYIQRRSNGTESGQSNAVVIAFDNGYNLMSNAGGGGFINTETNRAPVAPVEKTIQVVFTEPIPRSVLGTAPYNPFAILKQQRGYEVHLPGKMPTDLADPSLFGTADDDTNLTTGKTYLTTNNLPWAIHLPESFAYPLEKNPINTAFLKFNQWATSNGNQFTDWYKNNAGYRNTAKIY